MTDETSIKKAGYVAVVGRPNVGKSTLINAYLEQKIAAVSPKPQTTRRKQLGILTRPNLQLVFVDTPGIHKAQHKLGDYMNEEAISSLQDADVVLWLLAADEEFTAEDRLIAEKLGTIRKLPPVLIALSKADTVNAETLEKRQKQAVELFPARNVLEISATQRKGLEELLQALLQYIPEGEPFFDEDTVTDYYEKEIAAELIRESALFFLRDEVPHCLAVRMDEYKERGDTGAFIEATFFVERESQKGIVIGQGGEMLKKIGTRGRQEIEKMSGRQIYLSLRVKVNKNWRNSPKRYICWATKRKVRNEFYLAVLPGNRFCTGGLVRSLEGKPRLALHCQTGHPAFHDAMVHSGHRLAGSHVMDWAGADLLAGRGCGAALQRQVVSGGTGFVPARPHRFHHRFEFATTGF